jgi:hypothetical protein
MDYRLGVDRQHLVQGLKLLGRPPRRADKGARATVGLDGCYLTVDVGNVAFVAQATGAWPGNAIVAPAVVYALARVPPSEDPVIVTCDGEHVHFGPIKAGCKWQPVSTLALAMAASPEWLESIALRYTMPRGRVFAEGRGSELNAAERKLAALVRRVAKSLAPLGVSTADIESLVERRLEERFGSRPMQTK